ncbi:hypothetical protein N007_11950 [Alicyclobacillus acidoterrestris ATCC 49025]|nr:hypothetical protein N007_11950 [Alicyclobacillus acidoterrestris ATCC 49025]
MAQMAAMEEMVVQPQAHYKTDTTGHRLGAAVADAEQLAVAVQQ